MLAPTSQLGAQTHIPRGVADYFWDEAYARRRLEYSLLELFRTWGYQDVISPMFEYAETVSQRSSPQLQAELYRFLDRDGSTLALRSDMTIAVARLVGVRLHDRPMPQRFCYTGSVFRHTETQAGRQREFTQAGFELIGASAPAADAEVIALTAEAMRLSGLREFRIVLGQLQYFHALLQELKLTPEQTRLFLSAINRNSEAELAEFLRTTPLRTQQRHTVEELPLLSGPNTAVVIAHADRLCLNYAMHKALDNLREIYTLLESYAIADQVYLDLTEINNLGYYTGISFEILVPGLGFPVGGGGRYDNLIGTFGAPQPAVGVALGIDRLINVQQSAEIEATFESTTPLLLVNSKNDGSAIAIVNEVRRMGVRIASALDETQGEALRVQAERIGIPLAADWVGEGFILYGEGESSQAAPRHLLPNVAVAELKKAISRLQSFAERSSTQARSIGVAAEFEYTDKRQTAAQNEAKNGLPS